MFISPNTCPSQDFPEYNVLFVCNYLFNVYLPHQIVSSNRAGIMYAEVDHYNSTSTLLPTLNIPSVHYVTGTVRKIAIRIKIRCKVLR